MDKNDSIDLRTIGMEVQQNYSGNGGQKAVEKWEKYSPLVARWLVENVFGEVYANEVLDLKTRCLCTITALIVLGNESALANHLQSALRIGLKKEELIELIAQMVWYAGLPAATRAMNVFDRVLNE